MSSFFSFFLPSNPLFIFTFVKLTRREFTDQRSHLTSILPESTSNRPSSVVSKLPPRTSSSRSPQRPAPAAARRHSRQHVEGVYGVGILDQVRLHAHPLEPLVVPPLPVLERVQPPDDHHRRREVRPLPLAPGRAAGGRARSEHVRGLVVRVRAFGQVDPPQPLQVPPRHERQPPLRLRVLLPSEVGLDRHQPEHLRPLVPLLRRRPPRHVVRDVGPGAVAGEEYRRQVVDEEAAPAVEPPEDGHAVVARGGVAVLRRQAVVDRHDAGRQLLRQAPAEAVELGSGRGAGDEAAAVEVHDHGERRLAVAAFFRRRRRVVADGEVALGVDDVVRGGDAVGAPVWVRRRPDGVEEGDAAAVEGAVAALGEAEEDVHERVEYLRRQREVRRPGLSRRILQSGARAVR
ncbi:putative carboxylesterase 18 [Iris pallida]|uniref:Carboxylesterase 18 n=1 Tax=Iris pallida TaxID=29817 RepID=A0AAX6GFY7_IRIPA|nr:putative carboxylesterase 18 [Iris pallida]